MIDDEALQSIEKLHQLKTNGIITEEDFEQAKQKLLKGIRPQPTRTLLPHVTGEIGLPAHDDHFGWITLPLRKYGDFRGRSSRKEFWMFQLVYVALIFGTAIITAADTEYGETGTIGNLMMVVLIIALLGLIIPLLAVQVRRFQDQDKSGWLALLNVIPYLAL